jgi:hypothetical protein
VNRCAFCGLERIPDWDTHYTKDLEIVDSANGKTAKTIEGFSNISGTEAVKDANEQFDASVEQREREDAEIGPAVEKIDQDDERDSLGWL